jgi:mannitol/fructose-specific phosphotransferase system IIA component (Ntr-type)
MDLNDYLGPDPIIVDLRAENRWDAIDELLDHLVDRGRIKPENRSAIGDAVKIPGSHPHFGQHCQTSA